MIAACFRSAPSILPFRPQRPPEVWLPGRLAFRPAYTLLYSLTPGLGGAGVASHTTHACRFLGGLFFLHKMAATENTCCGHVIGKGSLSVRRGTVSWQRASSSWSRDITFSPFFSAIHTRAVYSINREIFQTSAN